MDKILVNYDYLGKEFVFFLENNEFFGKNLEKGIKNIKKAVFRVKRSEKRGY